MQQPDLKILLSEISLVSFFKIYIIIYTFVADKAYVMQTINFNYKKNIIF